MSNNPFRICILGGGFGGLYTALYLSRFRQAKHWQITLVEQKDRFLFTPLLYELLTEELPTWAIAPSYEKLLARTPIHFCQRTIENVNLRARQVQLQGGEKLPYDYLVLAVGSQTRSANAFGVATHAFYFRTLADVERLQAKLREMELSQRHHLRVAIVGGGPNGVEVACKLADRLGDRGQICLIERGAGILKGFSPALRTIVRRSMKARNIRVELETQVKMLEGDRLTLLRELQITALQVDLALWTAGTQPFAWVHSLAKCSDRGKILTRDTLQLIDYPEVFALGDVAEIHNSSVFVPATAQAAYQQAAIAAQNIRAVLTDQRLRHFRYFHLGDMLTLGKGRGIVSSFSVNLEGALAEKIRRLAYIQRLPTLRHRLQVLKHWLVSAVLRRWRFQRRNREA